MSWIQSDCEVLARGAIVPNTAPVLVFVDIRDYEIPLLRRVFSGASAEGGV